jgi:hypothetical protein
MPDSGPERLSERPTDEPAGETDPPKYSKPKLRRYDQIEQVKPYGPSERRAG